MLWGLMRDKLALVLPTALILAAEALFFGNYAEGSLELHLLNIFLCIMLSIFLTKGADLYTAFALVSLLRVLNIGMPRFFHLSIYFYPFIYLPVIVACFLLWYVNNVPEGSKLTRYKIWQFFNGNNGEERPNFHWWYVPAALIIGLGLSIVEYIVLKPESLIPDMSMANQAVLLVVMVFFVGFGEELVFRAILQTRVQEHTGPVIAIIFSSLLFAVMHSGYHSDIYLAYVFLVGLLLGYSYYRTKNLIFVALVHGMLNFFLFSYLPFSGWLV
ncbi:MAG: CAAX amino terminal protease self- immunity [Methanomassiliicoccales archaeon PtaU1.Bin124]|nr:MAG: CAAX amino terminal protease self- immunity [Methanomassiliicoccales archaeon PtaU1.Bin124]